MVVSSGEGWDHHRSLCVQGILLPVAAVVKAWNTRAEHAEDIAEIRAINLAAFPGEDEADLVDALRADPHAWIDGLSMVTLDSAGALIGHALITRCTVAGSPALALGPCAVLPEYQSQGVDSAAIEACLAAARHCEENLVVVLGHPRYYPRFGFSPASQFGITAPFDAPDDAFLALVLDPSRPTPRGEIQYPPAFGV